MTGDAASDGALLRTALYDCHHAAAARMVDFGGWDMPIQYKTGIRAEHLAVRAGVGVFDLSHMGRLYVRGADAMALVQWLTTNDASRLAPGRAQYSLICGSDGQILDDIIAYNLGAEMLLVVNASNRLKVLAWIEQNQQNGPLAGLDAKIYDATAETAMIGFQGPESERLLQDLVDVDLSTLRYYAALSGTADGKPGLIARTGYTGEDGFEVIVAAADGPSTWNTLLEGRGGVTPMACGLGARDTLRLEAGMPLYGHEIDESCNPFEAGLGRVVKLAKGELSGKAALERVAEAGPERKLIAFELTAGGVPRQGYAILDADAAVGQVTSGNVSPSLGTPIGMAYVPLRLSEPGTAIAVEIRGKAVPAKVVTLPFYPHKTKKIAAPSTSRS
ncbi:MAG: glycine cleavage system aminomethyltransferase GcvT [Chloroflexi bacterium]|nr:glycine cleavage system aminomethyltransferase GcvT [Chloroflexota bacterium]